MSPAIRLSSPLLSLAASGRWLVVPMLKEDELVGAITIYRQEVRPFTDKQIELVENFAKQAVIAIENARLLNDLRESLQQQTATSEVLQVISSSPGELASVFETILENATRVCEAKFGNLLFYDGSAFRIVAFHNTPSAFVEEYGGTPFVPRPDGPGERLARTKKLVHVPDLRTDPSYQAGAITFAMVERAGARSMILVPMLKDDELIGAITIYRTEVRPFTDKQIELVTNFAKQAVIAIENTRLLKELRQRTADLTEALEQQTATSEVLKVISSVPGALEPVFTAMLETATRICDARFGTLVRFDGEFFHRVAGTGTPSALVEFQLQRGPFKPDSASSLAQVMATKTTVHVTDGREDANEAETPPVKLGGARSLVAVPMLKDGQLIGAIVIYRQEVRPFSDKQIELVSNFATQAVIAIENARLLDELRESLQQQTATADVLKIISRSPFDLQTVLDTLIAVCGPFVRGGPGGHQPAERL